MKKRGFISGNVIKYVLIAFVIIFIQVLGFRFISEIQNKQCQAEIVKFKIDLENLHDTIDFQTIEERTYTLPCDADKVYFFDLEKIPPLNIFDNLPLIKDSLTNNVQKNVFLVKDNEILDSFYSGRLEFEYPHYSCMIPKFGNLNFFVEGKAGEAKIIPGCYQPECTEIPVMDLSEEQAKEVIAEVIELSDCEHCPVNPEYDIADYRTALKNVKIYRKIKYCPETGITTVEIVITPRGDSALQNLRFFEVIPKDCIEDLNQYLAENIEGEVHIEADPLIVWHFDNVQEEVTLNYKLGTEIKENCKELIEGLSLVEKTSNSEIVESEEDEANLGPSIYDFPLEFEFNKNKVSAPISLTAFSKGYLREELIWTHSFGNDIEIGIDEKNRVTFSSKNSQNAEEEITFTVTDPDGLSDSAKIKVIAKEIKCSESCEECKFDDGCVLRGQKICTKKDCSEYVEHCLRETEDRHCNDGGVCKEGLCEGGAFQPVCEFFCSECEYSDICSNQGISKCILEDCTEYESPCNRNTENFPCGDNEICIEGICQESDECEFTCTDCEYRNICSESGKRTCIREDCSGYEQECKRNTGGRTCNYESKCSNSECLKINSKISCDSGSDCPDDCFCGPFSGKCKKKSYWLAYCKI